MQRIADLIRANLRLRVFLPLLVLALAATWYGLGPSLDRIVGLTGARFVDMQPAITADALMAQARTWSPETVRFYLWWSAFDYAWPLLTFTGMLFIAAWLFRFLPAGWQRAFPWLCAAAYTTVLMDWGENAFFVAVALSDSPEPRALAELAVLLHRGKLVFNLVFNLGFFAALLTVLARQLRAAVR